MLTTIQKTASHLARFEIWPVAFFIAASIALPQFLLVALAVCILFWVIRFTAYRRFSIRTPIDWSAILLFLAVLVTLLNTAMPELTNQQSLRLLTGIFLFYSIANWAGTEKDLRILVNGTALVGLVLALSAPFSVQWSTDKMPALPGLIYERFTLVFSDWVHPNVLAGSLILILPITFSLVLFNWRQLNWLERLINSMASIIMLVMIVLTQSRGSWIAVASMVFIALLINWRRTWIGIILIVMVSIALIYNFGITSIIESLVSNPTIGDLNNRIEIWFRALYMIQDFPFTGIGMGLYKVTAEALYPFSQTSSAGIPHAHNLFLQVGVDLGIPGLVAWLSILVLILVLSWQLYRKGRIVSSWAAGVGAGLLLSQFALILHGLTDSVTWGMVRSAPIVWGIWGIAAASSSIFSKQMSTQNRQIMEHR
jgi:putative inorganic carbon (HCO3(-)) transporter